MPKTRFSVFDLSFRTHSVTLGDRGGRGQRRAFLLPRRTYEAYQGAMVISPFAPMKVKL